MVREVSRLLVVSCAALALAQCKRSAPPEQSAQPLSTPAPRAEKGTGAVLDVGTTFPVTESIGAKRKVHLEKVSGQDAHSGPEGWKLQFDKTSDFGGVCWKNKAGNEGEFPGNDLSGGKYRRIAFWAKGQRGGEVAEFRAGGLGHIKTRHRDTFDVTAGKIKLGTGWGEYAIYVTDADLSSVMTPFCVLFHPEDNTNGAVIFLDDIEYRG
jgi:hypothetical protein